MNDLFFWDGINDWKVFLKISQNFNNQPGTRSRVDLINLLKISSWPFNNFQLTSPFLPYTPKKNDCMQSNIHFNFIHNGQAHLLSLREMFGAEKWIFVTLTQSCGSVKWFHFLLCPLAWKHSYSEERIILDIDINWIWRSTSVLSQSF